MELLTLFLLLLIIIFLIKKKSAQYPKSNSMNAPTSESFKPQSYSFNTDSKRSKMRLQMPCLFSDGITYSDFASLAYQTQKQFQRITNISIDNAVITCRVASQSNLTKWKFIIDYNDWGHITGTYWIWCENKDSNIPNRFAEQMTNHIVRINNLKNIQHKNYSIAVNKSHFLDSSINYSYQKRTNIFTKNHVLLNHDSTEFQGEHLYPTISFLKNNGFCNIKSIPIKDVGKNSSHFLYEVEKVKINNKNTFHKNELFFNYSEILIYYHDILKLYIPHKNTYYKGKNYIDIKNDLEDLGFSNIETYALRDLKLGILKKPGSIVDVLVSGKSPYTIKTPYEYTTKIVIKYHSY